MAIKRVIALGDTHCGHAVGLTPPRFNHGDDKAAQLRAECWEWFARTVKLLGPPHLLIANGDLIDGQGARSGGVEQITVDRSQQTAMALQVLEAVNPRNVCITYGTAYHTGEAEDWEAHIADGLRIPCQIGSHEWPEVNGVVFDCKHHVGSSSVPHGRHTAIARDRLWNLLWAEHDRQPRASIYLRSHVHYFQYTGGVDWLAMTLPALQAAGTRYGARRCSGLVNFGLVVFDIQPTGAYTWQLHTLVPRSEKARAWKL
jgi:hypothetical protein